MKSYQRSKTINQNIFIRQNGNVLMTWPIKFTTSEKLPMALNDYSTHVTQLWMLIQSDSSVEFQFYTL